MGKKNLLPLRDMIGTAIISGVESPCKCAEIEVVGGEIYKKITKTTIRKTQIFTKCEEGVLYPPRHEKRESCYSDSLLRFRMGLNQRPHD